VDVIELFTNSGGASLRQRWPQHQNRAEARGDRSWM